MKQRRRAYLLGICLLGAIAPPTPIRAADATQTYAVTSTSEAPNERSVTHEVLSLERTGDHIRLAVSNADGSFIRMPVTLTQQGQIASNAPIHGLTCFNMAMNVIAHTRDTSNEPPTVFVQFIRSVVQVPLHVLTTRRSGAVKEFVLSGESQGVLAAGATSSDAGIRISADVTASSTTLIAAIFREQSYVQAASSIVSQTTCELQRVRLRPATITNI